MNDEAGFVDALARDPADETARFAYADWLQDRDRWTRGEVTRLVCAHAASDGARLLAADWFAANGEADRAEFVRVQCELAQLEHERCYGANQHDWTCRRKKQRGGKCRAFEASGTCARCAYLRRNLGIDRLRERQRELLLSDANVEAFAGDLTGDGIGTNVVDMGYAGQGPEVHHHGTWLIDGAPCIDFDFRRGFIEDVFCDAADWLSHGDAICAGHPITRVTLTTRPAEGRAFLSARWPGIAFSLPPISGTGGTVTFGGHAIPVGSWSIAPGGTGA